MGGGMRALGRSAWGVFLAIHPFPAAMNALGALAVARLGAGIGTEESLILAIGVALAHASIGAMNDVVDFDKDRLTAPHKPIVGGLVSRPIVRAASWAFAVLSLIINAAFGWQALAIAGIVLAAG